MDDLTINSHYLVEIHVCADGILDDRAARRAALSMDHALPGAPVTLLFRGNVDYVAPWALVPLADHLAEATDITVIAGGKAVAGLSEHVRLAARQGREFRAHDAEHRRIREAARRRMADTGGLESGGAQ
ncbi:hypothetical protein [Nocardiopsis suaedae]|uniref:STAS domain-containing protein n=1 Tax=Nocardiopsis suaedae TaxID=3018444 RepID=A0ABT4TMV1_9ACTN|nr:hypothetical protein [Nocardiopsis suaedae]MDA2805730.1 hypothetical protein [Nocardiopsis suaedae]